MSDRSKPVASVGSLAAAFASCSRILSTRSGVVEMAQARRNALQRPVVGELDRPGGCAPRVACCHAHDAPLAVDGRRAIGERGAVALLFNPVQPIGDPARIVVFARFADLALG